MARLFHVNYTYDKIGNLKSLKRHILKNNVVQQQNYNYVYQPNTNRLLKVESGANRYTYDQNGNMISDKKKNLNNTIYGRANLPSRLDMGTDTVTYIYDANDMRIYKKVDSLDVVFKEEYYLRDATGRELAVIDNNYNINWYIYGKERVASMKHEMPVGLEKLFITGNISDGMHYAAESIKTDGSVQSDATLEAGDRVSMLPGFTAPADAEFKADIKKPDGIPNFIYYLYDHLGNTRVTYHVDIKADTSVDYIVESASDYYPYGKALRSFGKERYQSTYHERDLESGFDYRGARFYDSDVARFNSLDPLADLKHNLSFNPFHYVAGNPIFYVDPNGMDWYRHDETGEVHWEEGSDDIEGHTNIGAEYILEGTKDYIVHNQNDIIAVISKSSLESVDQSYVMAGALATSAILVADDVTVIGVVDDIAIPVILAGAITYDLTQRTYITYNLTNPSTNQVYSGRSSGFGDPYSIMLARYRYHHKRGEGFEFPTLDKAVQGAQGYPAIRGREQQLIDSHGRAWSEGGTSGNAIRGVGKYNRLGILYHNASNLHFGLLYPYTGY